MVQSLQDSDSLVKTDTLKVVIQGVEGAFHEVAARFLFDDENLKIIPAHTFEEVVEVVENNEKADIGLMAIENTLAGSLLNNYRLLHHSKLCIVGEVFIRIRQNLMALPGVTIDDLKEVRSHPIALAQCMQFFSQYPHIKLIETEDTALSAKEIFENGSRRTAALASDLAAEKYGLNIIASSIETNKQNYTRFLVVKPKEQHTPDPRANKVSMSFSMSHKVGSLHSVLAILAAYGANLTKIQSAPIVGKPWEYKFFIDFVVEGDLSYEQGLEAIRPITQELKVLGAYRQGKHFEI